MNNTQREFVGLLLLTGVSVMICGCRARSGDTRTLQFIIESSPNNLDLRQGNGRAIRTRRRHNLRRTGDEGRALQPAPWLATSWDRPDALTWVFHLRDGVRFHDGKPMGAEDVAWSMRSMMDGTLVTAKGGALAAVSSIEVRDPLTVIVRMKRADNALLFNLSDGLFGVVELGAGKDEGQHPIGTGPFQICKPGPGQRGRCGAQRGLLGRRARNRAHTLRRRSRYDYERAGSLKKGSGDAESNVITYDMVHALRGLPDLRTDAGPGSIVIYANFNVNDPSLRDKRVRQAVACAMDKTPLIAALWRGEATPRRNPAAARALGRRNCG